MSGRETETVPILRLERSLIASLQSELTDSGWNEFRDRILEMAGDVRATGAIIDVSRMSVMDSFAGRTLSALAKMLRLRGVDTVVVGVQPAVAFSMVQLGLELNGVRTALDLDHAVELLREQARAVGATDG